MKEDKDIQSQWARKQAKKAGMWRAPKYNTELVTGQEMSTLKPHAKHLILEKIMQIKFYIIAGERGQGVSDGRECVGVDV